MIDNGSTDGTIDIVRQFFPAVRVEFFGRDQDMREDTQVEVKNRCWKNSTADFVVVCDTDEFLYADDLESRLDRLRRENITLPVITGYNMGTLDFPTDYTIPIYRQVTTGIRDRQFDKQILFNPRNVEEINYGPGCHFCDPVIHNSNLREPIIDFKLLHFKFLGKEYLYKKHAGYARRLSRFNIEHGYGVEYLDGKEYIETCYKKLDGHMYEVIG